MTNCPKIVKSFEVSFTISPVTQVADVEVNSASMIPRVPLWDIGKSSKKAPVLIAAKKLKSIIFNSFLVFVTYPFLTNIIQPFY
jgi:hypothetical protein